MTTKNTIVCPSWCDERHARNELQVGDYVHVRRIGDLSAGNVTIEQMVLCDHQMTGTVPVITLRTNHHDTELSASEARRYAAALLNAADELDRINGVSA